MTILLEKKEIKYPTHLSFSPEDLVSDVINNGIIYYDNENERKHREKESFKVLWNNEKQREHERWMTAAVIYQEQERFENQKMLANLEFANTRCQKLGTEEACSPLQ